MNVGDNIGKEIPENLLNPAAISPEGGEGFPESNLENPNSPVRKPDNNSNAPSSVHTHFSPQQTIGREARHHDTPSIEGNPNSSSNVPRNLLREKSRGGVTVAFPL